MLIALIFATITMADCGQIGKITERLESCKSIRSQNSGFEIVTEVSGLAYLYHAKSDSILSPEFEKKFNCSKPFKKYNKLMGIKLETDKSKTRCILKDASRYILVENEIYND